MLRVNESVLENTSHCDLVSINVTKVYFFKKSKKMSCALGSIATLIVAIQFFAKVLPWLYENFIGPMILGPKLRLRGYGDWACK